MAESFHCPPETITTLLISYTLNKIKGQEIIKQIKNRFFKKSFKIVYAWWESQSINQSIINQLILSQTHCLWSPSSQLRNDKMYSCLSDVISERSITHSLPQNSFPQISLWCMKFSPLVYTHLIQQILIVTRTVWDKLETASGPCLAHPSERSIEGATLCMAGNTCLWKISRKSFLALGESVALISERRKSMGGERDAVGGRR